MHLFSVLMLPNRLKKQETLSLIYRKFPAEETRESVNVRIDLFIVPVCVCSPPFPFFFFLSFFSLGLASWSSLVGSWDSFSAPWGLEEEDEEKGLKFFPILLDPMRRKGSLVGAEDESSTCSTYRKRRVLVVAVELDYCSLLNCNKHAGLLSCKYFSNEDSIFTSFGCSAASFESRSREPELWNLMESSEVVEGVRWYLWSCSDCK